MICKKVSDKIISGVAKCPVKMSNIAMLFHISAKIDKTLEFGTFIDNLQKDCILIIDDEFESEFYKKVRSNYEPKNTKADQKRIKTITA